jgi:hypothetical protein
MQLQKGAFKEAKIFYKFWFLFLEIFLHSTRIFFAPTVVKVSWTLRKAYQNKFFAYIIRNFTTSSSQQPCGISLTD